MKKNKNQILTLIICMALTFALLGSCGGKPAGKDTDSNAAGGQGQPPYVLKELSMDVFDGYDLTLVNCFTTWCPPCIKEIPELNELLKEYRDSKVNVIGVVLDTKTQASSDDTKGETNKDAMEKALALREKTGASYDFYIPDLSLFGGRFVRIEAVPETFFVDGQGNIVGETYVGARDKSDWAKIVNDTLNALKKSE